MTRTSKAEYELINQIAVAFAQVTFGIVCATGFTFPLNKTKIIVILINAMLTSGFIGGSFLVIRRQI